MKEQNDSHGSSIQGQIDTRATVSCSDAKHLFHICMECTKSCKSPARLCATIHEKNGDPNESIIPEGEGFLPVPACPIKAQHSPHSTSTPIGDDCIMGQENKREHDQFKTQSSTKHPLASVFSVHCHWEVT